jgi:hypothetical protein
LPGRMISDFILFALAFHFIKKIGNIHFFWQAVPQINHLKMVATSDPPRCGLLPGHVLV